MNAASEAPLTQPAASDVRPRVGFIVGPTGAGKTALAIEIAAEIGAEIVNADSRQVYRGMDIGTAKPDAGERRRVAHHMVDVRDPDNPLDVAEFARMATNTIQHLGERRVPVLVVGGSNLYVRVLRGGIFSGPPASPELRSKLTALAEREGSPLLHQKLNQIDPEAARRIGPNDLKRIIRALEVYELTAIPISEHQRRHRFADSKYRTMTVALAPRREDLYRNIDRRFDAMIEAGLVHEVRELLAEGYDPETTPLSTIGYREIVCYLRGETSLVDAIEEAKRETRRLAKRQLTWLRADSSVIWLAPDDPLPQARHIFQDFFGAADAE